MTFNRTPFLLLVFAIFIAPFFLYRLSWLATSKSTTGQFKFVGHTLELQGISSHAVIRFKAGNDSVFFNSRVALEEKPGAYAPVRYQKSDPEDARVNTFSGIWGETMMYALGPFLIFITLAFTPERMDPVIPRNSKIVIGKNRFLTIVRTDPFAADPALPTNFFKPETKKQLAIFLNILHPVMTDKR